MWGRALDLDALMSLPTIFWARVSPDQQHITLNIHRLHPSVDVFALTLEDDGPLQALTNTPERTVLKNWAPDSRSVLVAEDQDGNERQTLYEVFLEEPGRLHTLTEAEPDYYLRGGEFDPRGEVLVYAANYDFEAKRELETFRVIAHEVASGTRQVIAVPEKRGNVYPSISPDGRWVLYNRKDRHPAGTQYWIVGLDGTDDREVLNFGDEASLSATWTYDGRVAFLTDSLDGQRQDRGSVGLFDPVTEATKWFLRPSEDPRNVEAIWSPSPREHLVMQETQEARDRVEAGPFAPQERAEGRQRPPGGGHQVFLRDLRTGTVPRTPPMWSPSVRQATTPITSAT